MRRYASREFNDEMPERLRPLIRWLREEFSAIQRSLDTVADLDLQTGRTDPSGRRFKDREGMFRYAGPDATDPYEIQSRPHYFDGGNWLPLAIKASGDPTDPENPVGSYDYMSWAGEWGAGTYAQNQVVRDDGWLMIANKDTEDRAAPQPIGDKAWIEPDAPAWVEDTQSTNVLITGQRYTFATGRYLTGYRLWVPAGAVGTTIELWLVRDPTGDPDYTVLVPEFVVTVDNDDQWLEFGAGLTVVPSGTTFDIAMVQRPTTGESSWSADWDYKRKNGDPSEGEAWHQSGGDELRINYIDKDDNDWETELRAVGAGDTIAAGGVTWTVLGTDFQGSHARYTVEPASRAQGDLYTITFTTWAALPIPNVEVVDYHSSNSQIQGIISTTGYPDGVTLDENAYGVDIQTQEAYVSPDWDAMAYSGF